MLAMPSALLGARTGLRVGRLGLGGAGALMDQYGPVAAADVEAIVAAARRRGVTVFDTAPAYGERLSERRLGAALAGTDVLLATKVGMYAEGSVHRVDVSADAARRSIEMSLTLLARERLDLVQLHEITDESWSAAMGRNGAVAALERARDEGLVRWIGVTGSQAGPLLRAIGTDRFDTVMVWRIWNLLDRSGDGVLDAAQERGVGALVGGPFASGILASGPIDGSLLHYRPPTEQERERVRALERRARARGRRLRDEALAFCLDERVACVVAAVATEDQLHSNADAAAALGQVRTRALQ